MRNALLFILIVFISMCAGVSLAVVVNVDVENTSDHVTYAGQGAYSDPGNNYWNRLGSDLLASDGTTATAIDVSIDAGGRHSYSNTHQMMNDYSYWRDGDTTITVTGLTPDGDYTIYVYCQGDQLSQAGTVTFGDVTKSTTGNNGSLLVEDENYVVIEATADSTGGLTGLVERNGSRYSCINGLQIVREERKFVHPGLSHKKSDLDRMKFMVRAKIDPWYSSYQDMCAKSTASYDYTVKGDVSITNYGYDRGWKDPWFNDDARAAYYGALRWYIEEDERYAEKAIEAIMAWTGITNLYQKMSLTSAPIWLMIEAAEIIKHTYDGWAEEDIQKFADMLVYPGYSNTTVPSSSEYTWYWTAYMFDEARAGNQELCGVRTVAAIGVFLDNEIIYDRAMRYVSNLPARSDDLPYARGPRIQGDYNEDGSTDYSLSYSVPDPDNTEQYADWGYCGVLPYNIYPNGQNVESSRDQGHTCFSLGLLSTLGEIGWNQGYDLWGLLDSRILTGLEYTLRYCVSGSVSYDDQPESWEASTFIDLEGYEEPEAEHASYDFIQIVNRTKRNKSIGINPDSREGFTNIYSWELPVAHYVGRGLKTEDDVKWTTRARDYSITHNGKYENASTGQDYTGFGGLSYRRPDGCYGDPIGGFDADGLPDYAMNVLPGTIEAENFDYFTLNGEGRIYHDVTSSNSGGQYRTDENVDIEVCSEGGYNLTNMENGEWIGYTVAVPYSGTYDLIVKYAAAGGDGNIQLTFGGSDITGQVPLPATGSETNWVSYTVATDVPLTKGVQNMRIYVSGVSNAYKLDSITVNAVTLEYGFDAFSTIEAEDVTVQSGIDTENCDEGGENVGWIHNGDWCAYYDVDFGSGATGFQARLAGWNNDSAIEIRLGSDIGPLLGTCPVPNTGGTQKWATRTVDISGIRGVHDVYLVFTGGDGYLFNVNWFTFTPSVKGDLTFDEKVNMQDVAEFSRGWKSEYILGDLSDIANNWLYGSE